MPEVPPQDHSFRNLTWVGVGFLLAGFYCWWTDPTAPGKGLFEAGSIALVIGLLGYWYHWKYTV